MEQQEKLQKPESKQSLTIIAAIMARPGFPCPTFDVVREIDGTPTIIVKQGDWQLGHLVWPSKPEKLKVVITIEEL